MLRAFGASLLDIEKAVDLEDVLVLDVRVNFTFSCRIGLRYVTFAASAILGW